MTQRIGQWQHQNAWLDVRAANDISNDKFSSLTLCQDLDFVRRNEVQSTQIKILDEVSTPINKTTPPPTGCTNQVVDNARTDQSQHDMEEYSLEGWHHNCASVSE
jgi:hypothetical protein